MRIIISLSLAGESLKCTNPQLVALYDADSSVLESYAAKLEKKMEALFWGFVFCSEFGSSA